MRPYDHDRDLATVLSIWNELNWLEDCEHREAGLRAFLRDTHGVVEELDGRVEAHVGIRDGRVNHEGRWLPLGMVACVTTSPVARVGGLASRLTAAAVADAAERGAVAAALGMFDQGFYDRFGFGTGVPDPRRTIDPRTLDVPKLTRRPVRLGLTELDEVLACKRASHRAHGAALFDTDGDVEAEIRWYADGYILGFRDAAGTLTHCLFAVRKGEQGPDRIRWMAWRTRAELVELLSLIRSLADSLYAVRMADPIGVCMLDYVRRPFEAMEKRLKGTFGHPDSANAWEQWRILQPTPAFAGVRAAGEATLTVQLTDPIADHLAPERAWRGVAGPWTLRLGESSSMTPGGATDAPVLEASINALSRWWLGVRPASHLALSDDFAATPELLATLDRCWRPPLPRNDWEF